MASKYQQGRAFEWTVRNDLREKGYDVGRTAGSKSLIDLFAVPKSPRKALLFIQVKLSEKMTAEKRIQFRDFCERAGATPILATKVKDGRRVRILYELVVMDGTLVEWVVN